MFKCFLKGVMGVISKATTIAFLIAIASLSGCLATLGLNEAPTVQMSIDPTGSVREGDTVTFSAAGSSDPDGDSLTFSWSFGDGNLGSGLTTSHVYTSTGTYAVRLTVADGNYEATMSKNITVIDSDALRPGWSAAHLPDSNKPAPQADLPAVLLRLLALATCCPVPGCHVLDARDGHGSRP